MSTNFGARLKLVREEKGIKRDTLANMIGTSSAIIGRYERGERTPSIDIAKNIAQAMDISLDYLVGQTSLEIDRQALLRLEDIAALPEEERSVLLKVVDSLLRDFKTRQAYA